MAGMEPQDRSSSPHNSSQFQRLPSEALARVLGAVPQQQRLASCALVCRAWPDAALAATTQLELKTPDDQPQRAAQLSAWLARHGSGLHSLSVATSGNSIYCITLELPWPPLGQLRCLSLQQVDISCSSSSTAGAGSQSGPSSRAQQLAQLTSLTSLVLKGCTISSGVVDMYQHQLPALRQLQELVIENWCDDNWAAADRLGAALAAALAQLTALTRLRVVVTRDGAAAVISSLSSLQQLQDVGLQGCSQPGGDDTPLGISWSNVPASVTALELSGRTGWQLQAPSGAAVPVSPSQLHELTISNWTGCQQGAAAATRALLAALREQQQLQSLKLHCNLTLPADQTQHFAALTASSQLTALSVSVAVSTPAPAVLSAILGAGRRLPLLQRFRLWTDDPWCGINDLAWGLAPQDVSRLLQACPGLRELEFVPESSDAAGVTWPSLAGAATAQLTKLAVGSNDVNTAFISQFLARLTGLQALEVSESDSITRAEALAALTALTGLMRLTVYRCERGFLGDVDLVNTAVPGQPPDVARQLRCMCRPVNSSSNTTPA